LTVGAAEQDVGLNTDRSQIAHAVLRGLRLQFAGGSDERHECEMDVESVLTTDVLAELSNRFEEGQALDVADRSSDLNEQNVHILGS
jgi:hypothetical protein